MSSPFYAQVLAWLSCHNGCLRSGRLKQIIVFSQYWRPEAQVISRYGCFGVLSGMQMVLCLYVLFSACDSLYAHISMDNSPTESWESHSKSSISKYPHIHETWGISGTQHMCLRWHSLLHSSAFIFSYWTFWHFSWDFTDAIHISWVFSFSIQVG